MNVLNKLSGIALLVLSAYMILNGLAVFFYTQGSVRSSEFSMQVTIVGLLAQAMVWLGLFAFWQFSARSKRGS